MSSELASALDWKAARNAKMLAGDVLAALKIMTAPVNPTEIAERLGIAVRLAKNPGWAGAAALVEGQPTIWVNKDDLPVRQRFTIAHELGHLLLHPLENVQWYRDSGREFEPEERGEESQANRFAADLLMPPWLLQQHVTAGSKLADLAGLFVVSETALKIQLGITSRRW